MKLAELKTLIETMKNLPCVMNQLEEVQVGHGTIMCDFIPSKVLKEILKNCFTFWL